MHLGAAQGHANRVEAAGDASPDPGMDAGVLAGLRPSASVPAPAPAASAKAVAAVAIVDAGTNGNVDTWHKDLHAAHKGAWLAVGSGAPKLLAQGCALWGWSCPRGASLRPALARLPPRTVQHAGACERAKNVTWHALLATDAADVPLLAGLARVRTRNTMQPTC